MLNRRSFAIIFLGFGFVSSSEAASPLEEEQFSEVLFDIRATIKSAGVSFNGYEKLITELVKAEDRYVRRDGSDKNLLAASDAYIEAKKDWEDWFKVDASYKFIMKNSGVPSDKMLADFEASKDSANSERDKNFELASQKLNIYLESKKSKKSSQSVSKKKTP